MPYERALALPPCLDLDMFVWHNILEGPEEALEGDKIWHLPAVSRQYGASQMVMLMAIHELGKLTIEVDPTLFNAAVENGHMIRKTPCVVWRVEASGIAGYGRNLGEALCKLLIVRKYAKS
jgi:hypothetical protein